MAKVKNSNNQEEINSIANITLYFEDTDPKEYNDIQGYQVNGELVAVSTKDGKSYVFPMRNIEYIEHEVVNV